VCFGGNVFYFIFFFPHWLNSAGRSSKRQEDMAAAQVQRASIEKRETAITIEAKVNQLD